MATLQQSVDDLAARLGRPLLVEDRLHRVVAHSEQSGAMDDVRRDSILRRRAAPEARRRLAAAGIHDAAGPLRIPGAPGTGLLPRVCVPVRHDGGLLGFLWFIDADPPMTEAQVAEAAAAAPGLGLTLLHESLAAGLPARQELEAVAGLMLGEHDAARRLVEAGAFPRAQPVTALVARPHGPLATHTRGALETRAQGPLEAHTQGPLEAHTRGPAVAPPGEEVRAALEQGALTLRRRLTGHHPLHLVRHDHVVLLIAAGAVESGPPVALAIAEELHAAMPFPVTVGVGRPRPELDGAAASYAEARHAAEVAARVPGAGRTAEWTRLGVYRMLTHLPGHELHPGLEPLLDDDQHLPLLETLETYLDLAGSAVATSRALRLHRTSLYYRLQRVEELAGTDLKDGGERLALHLSLKLARLSGRYRPRSPRPGS
ncbi:helix-turn-helix domain-containing protein [Nonomuraea sp. SMC257]|uniref:Helix-turn-helix domain-containing protein n=1 Tax=Nonomuraea montanisoli TaxID=2741721 RepID=A0A7Y6I467_9ACTN|nr:helix-turn-helix domain-containing protein [Nonomuraea montanisoli]NUW30803.1 helix-turn-helix domain-containing protein [Nonomuraea montanisoli]